LMRRFMMRISEKIAIQNNCHALVTGENLGQVASQTMEALRVTEDCLSLPVLRPLIGMDKTDIVKIARNIGTFETSILPYEDCCTVFTPLHPSTKPKLDDLVRAETQIDGDKFMAEAVAGTEKIII
ncbi:MAG: tRNA 4-thiouridine(8) synthase ThiI, partial [Clostridia bacterium]